MREEIVEKLKKGGEFNRATVEAKCKNIPRYCSSKLPQA
jgi:hypothetical protein